MANEILRMNYFNELKLFQEEFRLEQDYHIRMRRLHNRHLHTWGIVWGLDVIKKDPANVNEHIIRVTEGMALNLVKKYNEDLTFNEEVSEEIVNTNTNYEINLRTITPPLTAGDAWVYAYYEDKKYGRTQKHKVGTQDISEPIYWKETATIEVSNTKPTDPSDEKKYILLARIIYDDTNCIINGDPYKAVPADRAPSAGANIGSISTDLIETKNLTLSLVAPAAGALASINGTRFGRPSLPDINGIKIDSPMTEFTGSLRILNNVDITGNLILNGRDISKGWVRLPFLPRKYVGTISGFTGLIKEFVIESANDLIPKAKSFTIPNPNTELYYGWMNIPIPLNATKITSLIITGRFGDGKLQISLNRISNTSAGPTTAILLSKVERSGVIGGNLFEQFFEASFNNNQSLDNTNILSLLLGTGGELTIYCIGAKFE